MTYIVVNTEAVGVAELVIAVTETRGEALAVEDRLRGFSVKTDTIELSEKGERQMRAALAEADALRESLRTGMRQA